MKKLIAALIIALPFVAGTATAEEKKAPTAQQSKMSACSAEGKGKKGDEYKAFMKECLAKDGKPADAAPKAMTQQEKMKQCAAKNKGMKGDEYKKAQSECLKG